jgi:pyruvate dehydrogenase E2 component (dihydrolipoamide acetyltransferase)
MPKLGMSMEEGAVVEWPVALGDRVEKGVTVLVIESEKAEVEIEATASGFLRHVYVEADPDERVPCGTVLAVLTDSMDEPFDPDAYRVAEDRSEAPRSGAATPAPAAPPPRAPAQARATRDVAPIAPAARALAKRLGIDPGEVPGSGPGGRVLKQDVETWAARREVLVAVADGLALEVPVAGEGDPVLLLPGFGTDVAAFARQTPMLAEDHRVRGMNPRGVGLSDAPDSPRYDVVDLAADASALIDAPTHVIGASLGAAVALELALTRPERVRSLTLITPFLEAGPRLLAVTEAWCRVAALAGPEAVAAMLLPWLFSEDYLADERARGRTLRGLAEIAARVPATTLERSAAGLRSWSGSRADAVGDLKPPTLVLVAGGDLLTPGGEAVARAIPGARSVVVPDAGHALALEAPDRVNDAIRAHLSTS